MENVIISFYAIYFVFILLHDSIFVQEPIALIKRHARIPLFIWSNHN